MLHREPESKEWSRRFTGPNAEVWMHERCLEEMKDLGDALAKIEATMGKMYCQMERPQSIHPSRLNRNEGRHGADKVLVQAFKNRQGRVYGVEGSIRGKRVFFAALACVKKRQKADPDKLEQTVKRLKGISKIVPEACV